MRSVDGRIGTGPVTWGGRTGLLILIRAGMAQKAAGAPMLLNWIVLFRRDWYGLAQRLRSLRGDGLRVIGIGHIRPD